MRMMKLPANDLHARFSVRGRSSRNLCNPTTLAVVLAVHPISMFVFRRRRRSRAIPQVQRRLILAGRAQPAAHRCGDRDRCEQLNPYAATQLAHTPPHSTILLIVGGGT